MCVHLHVRYFLLFLLGLPSPQPFQHLRLKSMEKNVSNFKVKCKGGTDSTKFCEHTCKNLIPSASFPCFQPKILPWWEASTGHSREHIKSYFFSLLGAFNILNCVNTKKIKVTLAGIVGHFPLLPTENPGSWNG